MENHLKEDLKIVKALAPVRDMTEEEIASMVRKTAVRRQEIGRKNHFRP